MTAARAKKGRIPSGHIVGIISSPAELIRANEMRLPPDLFELRLDTLYPVLPEITAQIDSLRLPLIITARQPAEGGANNLSLDIRRKLLFRFLPRAAYVDVELQSATQLSDILGMARARKLKRILSVHELRGISTDKELTQLLQSAVAFAPDIFKLVSRTNTEEEAQRLTTFFEREKKRLPLSVMGFGKFGRVSRLALARHGSVLNYVHLGTERLPGQLSLPELRGAFAR